MERTDKIKAVIKMQQYIISNMDARITLDDLCRVSGYSKYHAVRIFKQLAGRTPFEYIRAIRLTMAAQALRDSDDKIIDVALDNGFDSHDGFTRAFAKQFDMTPQKYQQETPAVCWFVPYTIEPYYRMQVSRKKEGDEFMPKEQISRTMTVTAVERPARKLILMRSTKATDYFSYCEEVGCEWEGMFNSIAEKFDTAALLTLPQNLMTPGTGDTAAGVEVPLDYKKRVPAKCEEIELPPCTMLYFQGAPFADENDFGVAIGTLWEMMATYDPSPFGWQYAPQLAPFFNYGTLAKAGAKMARPVEKII